MSELQDFLHVAALARKSSSSQTIAMATLEIHQRKSCERVLKNLHHLSRSLHLQLDADRTSDRYPETCFQSDKEKDGSG